MNSKSDKKKRSGDWLRLRRIYGYLFAHKLIFISGMVCTVLAGLTDTAVPWLMFLLLDADQHGAWISSEQLVYALPLALCGLFLVRGVLGFCRIYWAAWMQATVERDIRRAMISKLVKLPKAYHDEEASGVLVSRVMQFVEQMIVNSTHALLNLLQDSARLIGYLATMFFVNWKFALVAIAVLPLTIAIIALISRRIRRFTGRYAQALSELTDTLSDTVQGQTVVKSYGGQQRERAKLEGHLGRLRGFGLRKGVAQALNLPVSQMLLAVALAVILGMLAHSLSDGSMTEGEVSTFLLAMVLMPAALRNLSKIAETLSIALGYSERVFELLDAAAEDVQGQGGHAPGRAEGRINFKDVSFTYPVADGRKALDGFDLDVAAGEIVALVGSSGAGKTTVTSMLLGFYQADAGQIAIDGVPLAKWNLAALRASISVVPQDVILFDTSIAENVAYPHTGEQIDQQRLQAALDNAQISELVGRMPDGTATLIGERGFKLSGGERQRLSIARALYKDAPVLVFDEATSALDARTEQDLKAALASVRKDRTVIIIAHRLATVEIADRVVVMDRGRMLAAAPHAQLLESSDLYRDLYEAQRLKD